MSREDMYKQMTAIVDCIDLRQMLASAPVDELVALSVDPRRQFVVRRQSERAEIISYANVLPDSDKMGWLAIDDDQWVCMLDSWLPEKPIISSKDDSYMLASRSQLKLVIATKKYFTLFSECLFSSPEKKFSDSAVKCAVVMDLVLDYTDMPMSVRINGRGVMPAWRSKGLMSMMSIALLQSVLDCVPDAKVSNIAIHRATAKFMATSATELAEISRQCETSCRPDDRSGVFDDRSSVFSGDKCLADVLRYQRLRQQRLASAQYSRIDRGLFARPIVGAVAPQYPADQATSDQIYIGAMV